MNKITTFSLILTFVLAAPNNGNAVFVPKQPVKTNERTVNMNTEELIKYDRKEIEQKIGRKLKFKETLALMIVKKKLKKNANNNTMSKAQKLAWVGFIFSMLGLLSIGFALGGELIAFFFISMICGILGLIISWIALSKFKGQEKPKKGKGLAIAGLVTGILIIAFWVILVSVALSRYAV